MGEDGGSADVQKMLINWTCFRCAFIKKLPQERYLGDFLFYKVYLSAEPLFLEWITKERGR
jgi:hypothetical protein